MKSGPEERECKQNLKVPILYEDENMLALNKPAGHMVHGDDFTHEGTLVDWFLAHTPSARGVGEAGLSARGKVLERSGVVHRLDRETSGVLILAKNDTAFLHLKTQFQNHEIGKEYRAFVYGTMKEKWGTIDRQIGRSTKDFRLRSAQRGARGTLRNAITNWELISQSSEHAYLKLSPRTGRTHQIRVHLKAIGRPVIADTLYAPPTLYRTQALGFKRLALHAYSLTFRTLSSETITIVAPLPPDFEAGVRFLAGE